MQLFEQYRPARWEDVVGQDKALATIDALRKRGLAGRALWISGQSGTGKTTIARLIAAEIASEFTTEEIDAECLTAAHVRDIERQTRSRPVTGGAYVFIVNESHGLRKDTIRQLLVTLERIPAYVCWIFTTTIDGQDSLFDDTDDAHPLLSRCNVVSLSRRGLAEPFAHRVREVAQKEGLDGKPIEFYIRLAKECRNNIREMFSRVESGAMLD